MIQKCFPMVYREVEGWYVPGSGKFQRIQQEKNSSGIARKYQASISVDEEEEEILFHREVRVKQIEVEM